MIPKVSVIIPNYNHEDYLVQRIDSVLNQTFQDFELIILDDASKDGSIDILDRYANHNKVVQRIYNDVNSGSVFKQWIKGIQLAKGDYIWIAESDDFADVQFLDKTLKTIENNSKVGMVFTDSFKVDANGKIEGQMSKSRPSLASLVKKGSIINEHNFSEFLLEKLVIVNASSVLFKKNALLELDLNILSQFKNTGDVFVYLGLALNKGIYYLPHSLNYMRLHAHNTTKKNKKSGQIYKDKLLILDAYINDWNKLESIKTKQNISRFLFNILFFSIDYGHTEMLQQLIKKMYGNHFLNRNKYFEIKSVIFFYRYFMFNGRPEFMREWLKRILKYQVV